MTQEHKLTEPLLELNEELVIECLKDRDLQKIKVLIDRSALTESGERQIKLSDGRKILVDPLSNILELIKSCNYLFALRVYITEAYEPPRWDQHFLARKNSLDLHEAVKEGNQFWTELCLASGADPFLADYHHGDTPLHLAVQRSHTHLIEPLVQSLKTLPPQGTKTESRKKIWQPNLYKDFLKTTNNNKQTALRQIIEICYAQAILDTLDCYYQIRPFGMVFEQEVGQQAIRLFRQQLPKTETQIRLNVIEKLFQVGDEDPSKSGFFSKSMLQKIFLSYSSKKPRPDFNPRTDITHQLQLLVIKTCMEPHIMRLFHQPKYAPTVCAGLHKRAGRKSLLTQLQRDSPLFDPNILRLPLQLAGASKKPPASFAFFAAPHVRRTSYASLGMSPLTIDETPTTTKR